MSRLLGIQNEIQAVWTLTTSRRRSAVLRLGLIRSYARARLEMSYSACVTILNLGK